MSLRTVFVQISLYAACLSKTFSLLLREIVIPPLIIGALEVETYAAFKWV